MSDASREMTYSDLQVRVLDQAPTTDTEEAVIVAVTVQNTGSVDDTEQVRLFVTGVESGLAPALAASSQEQLEVDHSHRVRFTLAGSHFAAAGDGDRPGIVGRYVVAVGPAPEDIRVQETITLG